MRNTHSIKYSVLGFNGGLCSTTLLLNLIANNYKVHPLFIDYDQLNRDMKIHNIYNLFNYLNSTLGLELQLEVIKVRDLDKLYDVGELDPTKPRIEGYESYNTLEEIYYPQRVSMILNFLRPYAIKMTGIYKKRCQLAYGLSKKDSYLYPEYTVQHRKKDYMSFKDCSRYSDKVDYYTPFINETQTDVLNRGLKYCIQLGLDFNEVYSRTSTSYNPYQFKNDYYSDYKSPSSINRITTFMNMNIKDPIKYADETGPVEWEKAKEFVLNTLVELKHLKTQNHIGPGVYARLTQEQILDLAYETNDLYLYCALKKCYDVTEQIIGITFTTNLKRLLLKGVNKDGNLLSMQIGKEFFNNFLDLQLNHNLSESLNDLFEIEKARHNIK